MCSYPLVVPSLAELAREARGGLKKPDFAAKTGISLASIYKLEHGRPVMPATIDKLVAFVGPERGAAIRASVRDEAVFRLSDSRPRVRSRAHRRLPEHQAESREVKVWHNDPHWKMLASVWESLSVDVQEDLVNRASKALARAAKQAPPSVPKELG